MVLIMLLKRCLCGCTIVSSILGIGALILAILTSGIFDLIIRNFVLLGPNSMSKDMWIDTPKMQTSVYIFDVQNKDEVIRGGIFISLCNEHSQEKEYLVSIHYYDYSLYTLVQLRCGFIF